MKYVGENHWFAEGATLSGVARQVPHMDTLWRVSTDRAPKV